MQINQRLVWDYDLSQVSASSLQSDFFIENPASPHQAGDLRTACRVLCRAGQVVDEGVRPMVERILP